MNKQNYCTCDHLFVKLIFLLLLITKSTCQFADVENCEQSLEDTRYYAYDSIHLIPKQLTNPQGYDISDYSWSYEVEFARESTYFIAGRTPPNVTQYIQKLHDSVYELVIPPYSVPTTSYLIKVHARQIKPGPGPMYAFSEGGNDYKECFINYGIYIPIGVITGGHGKTVPTGRDIIINGDESYDVDKPSKNITHLKFSWTCTQQRVPATFCGSDIISTATRFTIPADMLEDGDIIEVTLNIEKPTGVLPTSTLQNRTVHQKIFVVANAAHLEVMKNCPPASTTSSNHQSSTVLVVRCIANCDGIDEQDYKWTIRDNAMNELLDFDYTNYARFGQNGYRFVLEKDSLGVGGYNIRVDLQSSQKAHSYAYIHLRNVRGANVTQCSTQPEQGVSSTTEFTFMCEQYPKYEKYLYELVVRDADDLATERLIIKGFYPKIQEKLFKLPPSRGKSFIVRVKQKFHPDVEIDLKVNVTSTFDNKTGQEILQYVNDVYYAQPSNNSVKMMISDENPRKREAALELFQNVIEELIVSKLKDPEMISFIEGFKYIAAEDILHAALKTIEEITSISHSLTSLANHNVSSENNPLLAKYITTVCKKMADKSLEFMRNQRSPFDFESKAKQMSSIMSKCLLPVHSNRDFDVIKPIQLDITTKRSIIDYPILTESYPNYEDHSDEYYKNLDSLKEATFNIINISSTSGKIMAMTTAPGEGFVETDGKTSSTVVAKDTGAELVKSKIRSDGIILLPSHDFTGDEHFYDILVTTWKKDIFWWNPARTLVDTHIINCEFWHSTCKERITKFTQPFMLNFELKENGAVVTVEYSLAVPKGYSSMSTDEINYQIRVHRLILHSGKTLFIHFHNMMSTYEVVLTTNKFPTIEEFTESTSSRIDADKILTLTNDYDYGVIAYVGILVDKNNATEEAIVTYSISLTTKYCLSWIASQSEWKPSCKVGNDSTDTTILCLCNHSSVFAGYVHNVHSDIQVVLKPDIELELSRTLIIFTTTVITFYLFFILLLLALNERKDCVYFLGDNKARDRFAYLLRTKTGARLKSGTSSNIIVKLTGEKKSSEPHVLNYPDPMLRYLQRHGQDMFLLTTQYHLGNLKQIELWFDCIGPSPAWYCKEITVYDLQLRTEWRFNINKRLSVIKGTTHIFASEPTLVENQTSPYKKTETSLARSSLNDRFKLLFDSKIKATAEKQNETSSGKKSKWRESIYNAPWMYHTWLLGQKDESLPYMKKLTLITSTILMTYTLALFYHGIPSIELKDAIDAHLSYEINAYDIFVAFATSFPTFLLHICIAWCFRISDVQFLRNKENRRRLSFHYTVVCWMMLAVLIMTSTSLLVIFGFWVPSNSSWIWLTSCAIGISFEIFVYEIIFIYILNYVRRPEMKYNLWADLQDIWKLIETQRRHLYEQFGEYLLRPYFQHLYQPLSSRDIKAKLRRLSHRYQVISELEDLFMFGIYVIILYVVILANKDTLIYRGKTIMKEIMEGLYTKTLGFHELENIHSMYEFINLTLIPSIHPIQWYGKYVASEPALMIDMANKYLGVARVRQHRIKRHLCDVAPIMRFLNVSCYPEFSVLYTESKAFGYNWGEVTAYLIFDRLKHIWEYSSQKTSATLGSVGEFSAYTGGGYIAFLGRTLYNSYLNFQKLLHKLWLNSETRVVFIEFLTYNANYNIFTSVRLIFEKSSTGFVYKRIDLLTVRMLFVQNEVEVFSIVSFIGFIFWVGMLFFKEAVGAVRRFRVFYRNYWLLTDFFITLMSISCIILFIVRVTLVRNYLKAMEEAKHNEFLSYFYLFYIEDILTVTAAILVCVATVRLWKFLRFGLIFRLFEKTLLKAAPTFLAFALLFFILVLAYAVTLVLILGNHFERIYSMVRIVRLLVTMAFKASEMKLKEYTSFYVSVFFLTLWNLTLIISKFVFIMIVVSFYLEAQREFSAETDPYSVKHYVRERLKYFSKFVRYSCIRRVKAGETYPPKVEPKHDKLLYLDSLSISTSKMRTMHYITQSVLRNSKQFIKPSILSHHDVKLMLGICEHFFIKKERVDEVDIFYKGRVKGKRIKFMDEAHIEKIVNIVNLLLQDELPTFEHVTDPALEECIRMIAVNQHILEKCVLRLKLMLHKINSIHLNIPTKFVEIN